MKIFPLLPNFVGFLIFLEIGIDIEDPSFRSTDTGDPALIEDFAEQTLDLTTSSTIDSGSSEVCEVDVLLKGRR